MASTLRRRQLLAAPLCLALAAAAFGQTLPSPESPAAAEIRHAAQSILDAANARDAAKLAPLLTASDPAALQLYVTIITQNNATVSRQTYQRLNDECQKAFSKPWQELPQTRPAPLVQFHISAITVTGDSATVKTKFTLPDGGAQEGTSDFRYIDHAWKMVVPAIPAAQAENFKTVAARQKSVLDALNRTCDEIHAKKFATLEEARQAFADYGLQALAPAANATAPPPTSTLRWDLTKSHLRKDVDWPADTPAVSWMVGDDKPYQLDLQVSFLPHITLVANDIELSSGVKGVWPAPGVVHPDEPLDSLSFTLRNHLTANQLLAFVDKLHMTDAFQKQIPGFPPAPADRYYANVHKQFEPDAGVVLTLLNVRHLTGNKDDWSVSVRIEWGPQEPGHWK